MSVGEDVGGGGAVFVAAELSVAAAGTPQAVMIKTMISMTIKPCRCLNEDLDGMFAAPFHGLTMEIRITPLLEIGRPFRSELYAFCPNWKQDEAEIRELPA